MTRQQRVDGHFWRGEVVVVAALLLSGCTCSSQVIDRTREPPAGSGGGSAASGDASGVGGLASSADGAADSGVDSGADVFGPRSGSRLRVEALQAGEALVPTGEIFDTEAGAYCSPVIAEDGETRCLPGGAFVYYTDENCQDAIGVLSAGSSCGTDAKLPAYARTEPLPLVCPPVPAHVYSVLSETPAPATLYVASPFGCSATDTSSYRFFTVAPSPAEDWVKLTRETHAVTKQLGARYWHGADGSSTFDTLVLRPDGTSCGAATNGGGATIRCLPLGGGPDARYFDGNACAGTNVALSAVCEPLGLVYGDTIGTGVSAPLFDGCPSGASGPETLLYRAVRVDASGVTTTATSAGCESGGAFQFFERGDAVAFESFPELDVVHDGSGRLQSVYYESEGQRAAYAGAGLFFDTGAGSYCQSGSVAGDRQGCVPSSALAYFGASLFADATCTARLANGSGCGTPKFAELPSDIAVTCGSRGAWVPVLGRHAGPAFIQDAVSGACVQTPASAEPTYDVGSPVDPATLFSEVTRGAY